MNSKVLMLSIAVISVGLFAMPSTLSLFAGQHTFYSGSDVDCTKCHQDVYTELNGGVSTAHTTTALKACEGCHKTNQTSFANIIPHNGTSNSSTFSGTNITTDGESHAAVTLECTACHTGVAEELTGSNAAHTAFYYNASEANQSAIDLKGANTACIGCHTHTIINITWNRREGYDMVVDSTSGSWTMTFAMNTTGQSTTYSVGE